MKIRRRLIVLFFSSVIMLAVSVIAFGKMRSDMQENEQIEVISPEEEKLPDTVAVQDSESENAEKAGQKTNNVQDPKDNMVENQGQDVMINDISANNITEEEGSDQESLSEELDKKVQEIVQAMSREEKAAQLFFVTPEALTGYQHVTAAGDTTMAALQKYPVGGIVYFAQNLVDSQQTQEMLKNVQEYALRTKGIPVFLGVDEEGGRVLRIGSNDNFSVEHVSAMGELVKEQNAEDVIYHSADTIGAYLSELGFNVDFAPDADVLVNADNQVIGDRSFGEDPELVADMAWIYTQGLHNNQILACYKHFPGHGGTIADSHTGAAYLDRTLEELYQTELVPFADGSKKGIDFIMVAHISDREVTGSEEPASLSPVFVTDILRGNLGYQGIIITDSLSMGAVTEHYDSGEAAVLALQAGCDMLLMPQDFQAAYQAVLDAVADDTISQERLDESVERIIGAKMCWIQ